MEMLHAISKAVIDNNADIGFGFDGDGDRCGVIDNKGKEIFSDKIGLLIARNLSKDHKKSKFVVIEVPLLFEKNLEHEFDKIILVDVTEDIQEKRALLRKNMSKEKYLAIKANQIPNSEKINRSDFIINNHDEAKTRDHIEKIVKELNKLVCI